MRLIEQKHISRYSCSRILKAAKLEIEIVALKKPSQLTKFQIFQRTLLDFNGTVMMLL